MMMDKRKQARTKAIVSSFAADNPVELCLLAVRCDARPFAENMATLGLLDDEQTRWVEEQWRAGADWIMKMAYPYGVPSGAAMLHFSDMVRAMHGK
jgi:hypothetical protein